MLDRVKLFSELNRVSKDLFLDNSGAFKQLHADWKKLCQDPLIAQKVKAAQVSWPVPTWHDSLNEAVTISSLTDYHIASVDGSQIYPDRHMGISCYLINTGTVIFHYDERPDNVFLTSSPSLFTGLEDDIQHELSPELINGKRQDLELKEGVAVGFEQQKKDLKDPFLLLFDGSLIFWHLEAKDMIYKEIFFSRYIASLMALYTKRVVTASYISRPKSRELINIIRAYRCNFDETHEQEPVSHIPFSDGSIVATFLREGQRTIVFKNQAKISAEYPDAIHPHFFYLHVGHEVGRVEIPAWIAHDEQLVNHVAAMIFDQSKKGHGYPIALAEAHEQAVVKGADREFFYQLLSRMSMQYNVPHSLSLKLAKKRSGMGI